MNPLLLTVGNIYLDHNIFKVKLGKSNYLELGKDYFGASGEKVLGGSAVNVAMQFRKLGLKVGFIGKTGKDEGAHEIKKLLNDHEIVSDLICEDPDINTSMAVNLIAEDGAFTGVHYGDASRTLCINDINFKSELIKQTQAVYFGGTAKQPLLFKDCHEVFAHFAKRGAKIFYDPNRLPAEECELDKSLFTKQLSYVEGYFPNEDELLQVTDETSIDEALKKIIQAGVKFVALKLGAKGCRIKTTNEDFEVDAYKIELQTTVGAGDCFNATFIAMCLRGHPLFECAKSATVAAALKVSQNIWPDEVAMNVFVKNR